MEEKIIVEVEAVLWLNPNLAEERKTRAMPPGFRTVKITVPGEPGKGAAPPDIYNGYRRELDGACADIVVTTHNEKGEPAVISTRRSKDKCFGGCWWMQGGATHSYRNYEEFVAERAEKECGVKPEVQAIIGIFRTCAEDIYASTFQPCYVGYVSPVLLSAAQADKDHSALRLLTRFDLDALPEEEKHWYPMLVFIQALESMPD